MVLIQSLVVALAVATTPAADITSDGSCPAPARQAPLYPISMMRGNVSGEAVVTARIDDCGRVVGPRVVESSGHAALDQAAIDTVLLWVLNEDERRKVGEGWVNLPVRFGGVRTVVPRAVDWPRSHRRPVYLPDQQTIGFETIAEYAAGGPGRTAPMLKSPYASVQTRGLGIRTSTSFQQDRDDDLTYWLSYIVQVPPAADAPRGTRPTLSTVAVARYRLVEENGRAVVRVSLLCEESADACGQLRDFLMRGLPIAKPPRA